MQRVGSGARRYLSTLAFLAGLAWPVAGNAQDGSNEVDLELVLAVDISRSMDYDEQIIQRQGYADAFRHPEVLNAIAGGVLGRIAVTYVEWSSPMLQRVVVPWMIVDGPDSAETFAAAIAATPLIRWQGTSISGSLSFSAGLLQNSGFSSPRQVIDVSGDGPNNMGMAVDAARDAVLAMGITINGLPIMLKTGGPFAGFGIDDLDRYYKGCVIGGSGAFLVTVRDKSELAEAIRRKMVLEIAAAPPPPSPRSKDFGLAVIPATEEAPPVDCLIGEKLRRNFGR